MLIVKKMIRFIPFYMLSVCAGDNPMVSVYLAHDPQAVLSNAQQCYKEGLYDISFDLCQAYLVGEKKRTMQIEDPGIDARMLLGLNLLKKVSSMDEGTDADRFDFVEDSLLEICCDSKKTEGVGICRLVYAQDCAWRILAKLYHTQKKYTESAICLYDSLAVQYNAYKDVHPHVFPMHAFGQLHYIINCMRDNKEFKSLIEKNLTNELADDQSWFLCALFDRAWRCDNSLDAVWFLAQHSKISQNPKSEYEKIVNAFCLHLQLSKEMSQKSNIDLNEVRVELLEDHPELADSYSIMWCKNNNIQHYSEYEKIKKSYLDYVGRDVSDPNKIVFLAILRGQVIGKGVLRKVPQQWPVQYVDLNLFIDDTYEQKRVGAILIEHTLEHTLRYAQQRWQAEQAHISSNGSKLPSVSGMNIGNFLKQIEILKKENLKKRVEPVSCVN